MSSRSRTATSPLRDLALHVGKSSLTVADECLRFRYEESPDLLARMASRGELDYAEVLARVHDILDGRLSPAEARAILDPVSLSSLARLMAGRETLSSDFTDTADISRAVRMIRGTAKLSRDAPRIEGQSNLAVGRYDHVERMLAGDELDPDTRWILRTEMDHPSRGRPGATDASWLAAFNACFVDQGLLPIRIEPGEGAPFDRVAVDVPDHLIVDDADAPRVTVVMSTFEPDQSFRTAVSSLLAQTWRNLEVLVIDDCSPPEFDELLESVTSTDPRIRLLRMPVNGGTYKIRNRAIAESTGDFITFQDSDDWAHPERIAGQVTPLVGQAELVSSNARALRVHPDLTALKVGYNSFRRGEASLMFRKDAVIEAMGAFDETRKSADTEFFERLEVVFGQEANLYEPFVLVMTQLTEGSLSRDEFMYGWHHGARTIYGDARRYLHRQIAAGSTSPRIEPGGPRRIYAPDRILHGRDAPTTQCDVMWVSDWRGEIDRYSGASSQVEAVARAGCSTLVAQAIAMRHAARRRLPTGDDILRQQLDGLTRFAVWTDDVRAKLLLVTDPELLTLTRPPEEVGFRADRLVIVAGHPPQAPSGDWWTYDPASVERNAKRMFGVQAAWLPAHAGIADDLRAAGATGEVMSPRPLFTAPAVRPRPYEGPRGGSRLVVGTTGLNIPRRDRPSGAALLRMLPQDDDYDVRLRADPEIMDAVLKQKRLPPNWLAIDESMPLRDFLRQLDVFVALPTKSWGPELPWRVVAALAEGAIVVADPAYQQHLGSAAVYATAVEVHDRLKTLAADADRLAEQRERGYAFCRELLSAEATVGLVKDLAGIGEDTA